MFVLLFVQPLLPAEVLGAHLVNRNCKHFGQHDVTNDGSVPSGDSILILLYVNYLFVILCLHTVYLY